MRAWLSFLVLGLIRVALVSAQTAPPPIIAPRSGDVWPVGSTQMIKWSTVGVQLTDSLGQPERGTIWLGHLTNDTADGGSGFRLWVDSPLASDVPYANGGVEIVVPKVPTASDYFIAMKISNNLSQIFTIKNPDDPKGTGALPSSISVTTLPFSTASSSATSAATSDSTASSASAITTSAASSGSTSSATSSAPSGTLSSASSQSTATVLSGTSTSPSSSGSATSTGSSAPSTTPTNAAGRLAVTGMTFLSSVFAAFLFA